MWDQGRPSLQQAARHQGVELLKHCCAPRVLCHSWCARLLGAGQGYMGGGCPPHCLAFD